MEKKVLFSKGRRFVDLTISDDLVTFLPHNRWEYKEIKEWIGGKDAEFIVKGITKLNAQVVDFTQERVSCLIKDLDTKKIIYERQSKFHSMERQAGVRMTGNAVHNGKRNYLRHKPALSQQEILRMEFEKGCGCFRQCLLLANKIVNEGDSSAILYREMLDPLDRVVSTASDIYAKIYPCQPLHYLTLTDSLHWDNGTLYNVNFSNSISTTEQLFTLCYISAGKREPLYNLRLEKDGKWQTPVLKDRNGTEFPEVWHPSFASAITWLARFSDKDIFTFPLEILPQNDPRLISACEETAIDTGENVLPQNTELDETTIGQPV